MTSDRIGIYDRAWDEGMRLRYSNELVNTKIYRLIMDFEAEDTAFLLGKIDQTEAIRRRSSYVLGGIAIVAVVLMLLFVGILLRDINRSTRYRRALERANRDNEALLAAREKLMLAITHDIKAPLGSVMGYIDLLSRLTDDKREGTLPAQYEGLLRTPAGAGQQPAGLLPAGYQQGRRRQRGVLPGTTVRDDPRGVCGHRGRCKGHRPCARSRAGGRGTR